MNVKEFTRLVGRSPEQDELERVNCPRAGDIGHRNCGWCECLQKPVFEGQCQKSDSES